MPIEELLALYGCNDKGGGSGWNKKEGEAGENRLVSEELTENMEEDEDGVEDEEDGDEDDGEENDEEEDDDRSLESRSSSSITAAPSEKIPPNEESAILDLKKEKNVSNLSKSSMEPKSRSELHLLYQSEEGSVPEARLLRSAGAAGTTGSDEEVDEEEDGDYAPGEDEWRKVCSD